MIAQCVTPQKGPLGAWGITPSCPAVFLFVRGKYWIMTDGRRLWTPQGDPGYFLNTSSSATSRVTGEAACLERGPRPAQEPKSGKCRKS